RPEPRRQLLRIAQQFKESGEATIRARPRWRLLLAEHALSLAVRHCEKDHRHGLVGTALLRVEAEPYRRSEVLAGTSLSRRGQRCRGLTRAASAARSTPANPPRKGSSRSSTRSQRSEKPARPSSAASAMRAGYWSEPAM